MADLVLQRKNFVLTLLNKIQNFVWFCITTVIIVICMLIKQTFTNLRHMITFVGMRFV